MFVILPHQLFAKKHLPKEHKYIIWEHPHYFKKYIYNKKKLILHYGSMKYYYDYLKEYDLDVTYVKFTETPKINNYFIFDPIDKIDLPGTYTILPSPNFMLSNEFFKSYRNKTNKFFFNAFYMAGKKELDILPNINSTDKENQNKLPDDTIIPKLPNINNDKKYIDIGIKYINKYFSHNYGNTDEFIFPLTHKTAKSWLKNFIKYRFKKFGTYQDAIMDGEQSLFHSLLSTSINIGLINPLDVLIEVMKYKSKIPINSLEAFIRQLFWREYQRYCYIYGNFSANYFNNKNKLSKSWYDGTLGILPVDNCIKKAFKSGYLHHIERLMIIGNYMNISEIHPKQGFKWFMEFSCDSYEWVMTQNVLDMVFFVTGGLTMRRPYISSSNYILKMSNYKKDKWCEIWDSKYHKFIKSHKKKLHKFRYYYRTI